MEPDKMKKFEKKKFEKKVDKVRLARELLKRSLAGAREARRREQHAGVLLEMVSSEVRLAAARLLAVCPEATVEQFADMSRKLFGDVAARVRGGWVALPLRSGGIYAVFRGAGGDSLVGCEAPVRDEDGRRLRVKLTSRGRRHLKKTREGGR